MPIRASSRLDQWHKLILYGHKMCIPLKKDPHIVIFFFFLQNKLFIIIGSIVFHSFYL